MPRFDPKKKNDDDGKDALVVPEAWSESRCHVCQSKYRHAIDRMIAMGTGHTEISRCFGGEIDRRSISRHAKKHLRYEQAAVQKIIEQETERAEQNAEEGISGIVKRKVYLETALHKALEQVLGDNVVIEPRDAVVIIEALNRFDQQSTGAQLDVIKIQFAAFLQALKEISAQRGDPSLGSDILIRARQIAGEEFGDQPQLNP